MGLFGSRRRDRLLIAGEGKDILGMEKDLGRGLAQRFKDQWDRWPDLDGWSFVQLTASSSPEPMTRLNRSPARVFYIHCPFRLPAPRAQVAVISLPFMYNGSIDLNVRAILKIWRASGASGQTKGSCVAEGDKARKNAGCSRLWRNTCPKHAFNILPFIFQLYSLCLLCALFLPFSIDWS